MPQRDDKIGIHFGRISSECWESLGGNLKGRRETRPGAIVEEAIPLLVEALKSGREVVYPATLRNGITKKLWLKPATVDLLNDISDQTGIRKTPIILAALALYFALPSPFDGGDHLKQTPRTDR